METASHYKGLSDRQVVQSREKYGKNVLTPPEKTPVWKQLLEKFKDPIIRILLVALGLSFLVSCYQFFSGQEGGHVFLEPVGILVAVLLATGVGFYFEMKANRKFDVLNQVNDDVSVKVIRDGSVTEVARKEIVVGDIVLLEAGNEVPADGHLLEAVSMQVNESTLTGEPIIAKTTDPEKFDRDATYPSNKVLRGTTVMEGHGLMEVNAVGDQTEYGKVYTGSQIENNVETPLNMQLKKLSRLITKVSYAVAALIFVGRSLIFFLHPELDFSWLQIGAFLLNTFMIAVTVIVVTVPEGLPMSVALSLALSMRRMLEAHNLVRKMHACETMGACTVICTDKTGTLTQNQMRVGNTQFLLVGDKGGSPLQLGTDENGRLIKECIAANSTAFLDEKDIVKPAVIGNPTEGALLLWLREQGESYATIRDNAPIVEQLTFSTERKYMATVVRSFLLPGKKMLYVKGAPEIVLGMCASVCFNGKEEKVDDWKEYIESELLGYQTKAMRTLGFAYAELDPEDSSACFENGSVKAGLPLKFIGFVGISDPVRADVPAAISECINAGIDVKIVTGDTPATATEIARQVCLWKPGYTERNRITGPEFAKLSDAELKERVRDLKIISRARPMDKERLVKTLQSLGEVVAVTGDGTNDAPALNAAQVGLSMGDGTSVAKEASDITILNNAFSSITSAVMWGRSLYQNVQRFILFQLTINVIACVIVLLGAFLDARPPITVTQMLWVNLIMDTFAAMALASLPPNPAVMKDKPRKISDHIVTPLMIRRIVGVGILLVLVLFGLMQYFKYYDVKNLACFSFADFFSSFFRFGVGPQGPASITVYEQSLFFTFFVMLQFWNMFNAKAFLTGKSAFNQLLGTADGFLPVTGLILVGQIVIVRFGGEMFNVTPLYLCDWLAIILSTSVVLWIGEIARLFKRLKHAGSSQNSVPADK